METTIEAGSPRDFQPVATALFKAYLGSERDLVLADALDELIDNADHGRKSDGVRVGRLAEGKMLVLVGLSGAGKTRALERVFAAQAELKDWDVLDADSPLVSTKAPSPCTLKQLGIDLLGKLGYPLKRDLKEHVVWNLVRERLQLRQVRYLHIDELQHVITNATTKEAQKIRNTMKGLVQRPEWPISLILSGTPEIAAFLEEDTQTKRRCLVVRFDSLDVEADAEWFGVRLKRLVEQKAGLDVGGDAGTFAARVIHAAERQYGTAIEFVQDAALAALREGSRALEIRHFARVYKLRTGCADDMNVFTSRDWRDIRVGTALQHALSSSPSTLVQKKPRLERRK
ncbi:ATP-binding protein [Mesorhizobium sp. YIM 152430]|uniref:ATP-binding protein n=1 Tax=Mesorhizobium sp. YIM 152430 TaxID=3031761 RepID=UPI0023DA45DD|nr:ATP-binding protein [Mesorhizobium sp. YIM 152430]MDF1600869.1 ATP-binding protein [Mesorhizobium sp. YIM 152430]